MGLGRRLTAYLLLDAMGIANQPGIPVDRHRPTAGFDPILTGSEEACGPLQLPVFHLDNFKSTRVPPIMTISKVLEDLRQLLE